MPTTWLLQVTATAHGFQYFSDTEARKKSGCEVLCRSNNNGWTLSASDLIAAALVNSVAE
jgi:hypothetical protein